MSFREHKQTDIHDCISIINYFKSTGNVVNTEFVCKIVNTYFSIDRLSDDAKKFIGLE